MQLLINAEYKLLLISKRGEVSCIFQHHWTYFYHITHCKIFSNVLHVSKIVCSKGVSKGLLLALFWSVCCFAMYMGWTNRITAIESFQFLLHWNRKVVTLKNWWASAAPEVSILTTPGATSDNKSIKVTRLRIRVYIVVLQWNKTFQQLRHALFSLVCPIGTIAYNRNLTQSQRP